MKAVLKTALSFGKALAANQVKTMNTHKLNNMKQGDFCFL